MKIVGLTGGIGSGKTTVAGFFRELGVPVYIADDEAKKLMNSSEAVKQKIIREFGAEVYAGGELDRKLLASKVFHDKQKLEILNGIVHPEVERHFKTWVANQNAPYVVYEAAILFEKGGYKKCDFTILVTADLEEKINRLINRDKTTKEAITARMSNQWSDTEKRQLADLEIVNMEKEEARAKVRRFHKTFMEAL